MLQSASTFIVGLLFRLDQPCEVTISFSACDSKVGRWSASYIIQNTAGMELAFSLQCLSEVDGISSRGDDIMKRWIVLTPTASQGPETR